MFAVLVQGIFQSRIARADEDDDVIGSFFATYYYLALEDRFLGHGLVPMYDTRGNLLQMVDSGFKQAVMIEGSGRFSDGRVVRYVGGTRYEVSPYDYAIGGMNCALVPFHAIAVDPRQIALGSIVRVDETVGMTLPDGSKHSGLWAAVDTGGAILGRHIDLYIGDGSVENERILQSGLRTQNLTVRLVSRPAGHCPKVQ